MNVRRATLFILYILFSQALWANRLLIPMDAGGQKNHLKAYGIAFAAMKEGIPVDWLLNYKGGSFAMNNEGDIEDLCRQREVTYKNISDNEYARIVKLIGAPDFNGQVVTLDKAPRIAVFTPLNKEPWDDAVTLALTYAEIPFDKLYADEVIAGDLNQYDWLHLHHEDFTGEYSKFWANFRNAGWYINDKHTMEALAARHGFSKVSQLQAAVVKKIRAFVGRGGNLFAMCTATETFDIALAADGVDICDTPFDGGPPDPFANDKLSYEKCFAFTGFKVVTDPYIPFHSDIDFSGVEVPEQYDYFTLAITKAKQDPITAMLCQNHETTIKGFMGQTTAFREEMLKPGVLVLGRNSVVKTGTYPYSDYNNRRVKYIHGTYGKGTWTFYGGHDPESYKHLVGSAPTDLSLFPNSPGYRLIFNNLLLPAAKKALSKILPAQPETGYIDSNLNESNPMPANKVKMYPDPENNKLVLGMDNTGGKEAIGIVVITNYSGAEVFHHSYSGQKATIELKDFAPGIYQVTVNGLSLGKMIKQ